MLRQYEEGFRGSSHAEEVCGHPEYPQQLYIVVHRSSLMDDFQSRHGLDGIHESCCNTTVCRTVVAPLGALQIG